MTKWLRWQGLMAFGILFILLFLFWFFLADMLVKGTIEKAGTRIVGAKVELAKADLHLMPLGLTLGNLKITNPDKPMFNAAEARQIEFSLDSLNLLRRKIIIDTMRVESIRFNTPRKTSGAVSLGSKDKQPPEKTASAGSAGSVLPSFQIPDIQEILAREKLESLDQIMDLRREIDTMQTDWKKRLAAAPDQATFEDYRKRAQKLQKGAKGLSGALTLANDLKTLQKDVSKDMKQLKNIQKDFDQDRKRLQRKLDQLKTAPQKDMDRILDTYNLSTDGLGNVSQLLFGDKIGGTIHKAIFWYDKLTPILTKTGSGDKKDAGVKPDRGKGVYIRFKETAPLPDLLARQVVVSMIIPAGDIKGEIRQVTTDQTALGIPLEFNFSGDRLQDIHAIKVQGTLDHIDPNRSLDKITAEVEQYRVKDLQLSASDTLPITLANGLAHINLSAALSKGVLDAHVRVMMDAATLETEKKAGDNPLQGALQAALTDIASFSLDARVTGPLDNYKVKLTSSLDEVLKKAMGRQINNLTTQFKDKLGAGIADKIKGPMADTTGRMSGLDSITGDITTRLNLAEDVLNKNLKIGF
jgi:uncharacterized protein (TIGR03545 family)